MRSSKTQVWFWVTVVRSSLLGLGCGSPLAEMEPSLVGDGSSFDALATDGGTVCDRLRNAMPVVPLSDAERAHMVSVADFGAGNGGDDAQRITAALAVAANEGATVFFPRGVYQVQSQVTVPLGATALRLRGEGADHTQIQLAPGLFFIDSPSSFSAIDVSDLTIRGGRGALRTRAYENFVKLASKLVTRCRFEEYTGAAITSNSADYPNWAVTNSVFHAVPDTNSMGLVLAGTGGNDVHDNCFIDNRIHIKARAGGKNDALSYNEFRWSRTPADARPRAAVWAVAGEESNNGQGFAIVGNRFDGHHLRRGDAFILLAETEKPESRRNAPLLAGAGVNSDENWPVLAQRFDRYVSQTIINHNTFVEPACGALPLIFSAIDHPQGLRAGDNEWVGAAATSYLTFAAPDAVPSAADKRSRTNIFGPDCGLQPRAFTIPDGWGTKNSTPSAEPNARRLTRDPPLPMRLVDATTVLPGVGPRAHSWLNLAFQAACDQRAGLYLPPGHYSIDEQPLAPCDNGVVEIVGAGASQTFIENRTQGYAVEAAGAVHATYVRDITFSGGTGVLHYPRNSEIAVRPATHVVLRNRFFHFSQAAVLDEGGEKDRWVIVGNHINADVFDNPDGGYSAGFVLADSSHGLIERNNFAVVKVDLKFRGVDDMVVAANTLLLGTAKGDAGEDLWHDGGINVWVVPEEGAWTPPAEPIVFRLNKFAEEGAQGNDRKVLFAAEVPNSPACAAVPNVPGAPGYRASTGVVPPMVFADNRIISNASSHPPFIFSTTARVLGLNVRDNAVVATPPPDALLSVARDALPYAGLDCSNHFGPNTHTRYDGETNALAQLPITDAPRAGRVIDPSHQWRGSSGFCP